MTLWLNVFLISMLLFMATYVSYIGLLSEIPTLLILFAIGFSMLRIFTRTEYVVDGRIVRPFLIAVALAFLFCVKQVTMSGGEGATLAIKIVLYHATFVAGLLIGFYDDLPEVDFGWAYAALLVFLPLAFFIVFSRGNPPHPELFVFNRNPFAGYLISASVLLLGFGSKGQPMGYLFYIVIVAVALVINGTLGALLAFLLAVTIFFAPQIFLNIRYFFGALVLAIFVVWPLSIYLTSGGFDEVETFSRLRFVYQLFLNIATGYEGNWLELNMGDAVRLAPNGERDMSAVFRILHWIDILNIQYQDGSLLFGGGTNWVEINERRLVYGLPAHNEYVRLISEQGLLLGGAIIAAVLGGVWSVRKSRFFLPLMALTIYFLSENQMNDFATTCLFFFVLGHTVGARNAAGRA